MRNSTRPTAGLWIVSIGLAVAPLGVTARTQPPSAPSIVDRVVTTLCEKQIVFLGELPSHGEAQAFDLKARIADRLVQHCGFTALLFEAPVYDFIGFERAVSSSSADAAQLDNAIGRFWLTRELAPWRRSLVETVARGRLKVGGLDDQISITSLYARKTLPSLVARATAASGAEACRQAVTRHVSWTYDNATPFDADERVRLHECVRTASETAARSPVFDAADRVMLDSFARYTERQRHEATAGRDDSMFRNLVWYLDRLPPNSRVIVWTATVHAARQRGTLREVPLGAHAVARWGDRVGAVGFTAFSGHTSMAGRPASPIPETPPDSLEARATHDADRAVLDATTLQSLGRIPSRLFGRVTTEPWADLFDLVVVFRSETAPTFDRWK